MTFQTHPREQRDANDNVVAFDHRNIHLVDARSKARKLTLLQLAAEQEAMARTFGRGEVTNRKWYTAISEEAAVRFRAIDGAVNGSA